MKSFSSKNWLNRVVVWSLVYPRHEENRLDPLPDDKILDCSKLKQIADYILKFI